MKKLIAMIATVAVVLSMGATAFADTGDEWVDKTPVKSVKPEEVEVSIVGHEKDIQVDYEARWLTQHEYDKLCELVDDGDYAAFQIIDAAVGDKYETKNGVTTYTDYDAAQLVLDEGEFTFAFGFDETADVTDVYVFSAANDAWVKLADNAWKLEDGQILVKTSDDYTFAFQFAAGSADDADADADADADKKDDTKKSAATGYNSTAYIVCAIALAAGAAFFFGTSKKSAKEMM